MRAAAISAGYLADLLVGDPPSWHPVAGFGRVALAVERVAYAPTRRRGAAVAAVLVLGTALAVRAAGGLVRGPDVVLAAVTWAALGGRSLRREALRVAEFVERGELDSARSALRALCGRDAAELDGADLCRAAVESLAENTADAVVGALFWSALAGSAGCAAYRAANTLDAMFGHRSPRYAEFGWAAARLDDAMSWPGARLAAGIACLAAPVVGGSPRAALAITRRDGPAHPSPNAGRVEGAFAGALGLRLGGPLTYSGRIEQRPELGDGRAPGVDDVRRAARLSLAVGAASAAICAAGAAFGSGRAATRAAGVAFGAVRVATPVAGASLR